MEELPPPFWDSEREYDVKKQELDELLFRVDERTCNIYKLLEKQETHLAKLNNSVEENAIDCAKHRTGIRNIWTVIGFVVIVAGTALGIAL